MINQVRSDFESNRWTAFVLVGMLLLGLATWSHALATRASAPRPTSGQQQISVLPDRFEAQQQ
jgi:hypothetical protein